MSTFDSVTDRLLQMLVSSLKKINLNIFTKDQYQQLIDYILLLDKWNKVYNLTSIDGVEEMLVHHVLDSIVAYHKVKNYKTVLDVGTGAGIPGIILAIVLPEIRFCLLDSNKKKLKFVQHAITCLKLTNVELTSLRIEDFSPEQKFDLVVSRAFADLNSFLALSSGAVDVTGEFLAYKGVAPDFAKEPLPKGFVLKELVDLSVPGLNKHRCLVHLGCE